MKRTYFLEAAFVAVAASLFLGSTAFAGQVYNEQVSGETCEMVKVMSDLTPGKVLYTYRADPTCGNVRTGKSVLLTPVLERDKFGNITGVKVNRTVGDEDNGG